jgi:Helix-turn-helix domain
MKEELMSQNNIVLKHLKAGNSLSQLEALGVFRIYRLASRINDLRDAGHDIQSIVKKDATGKRYAEYRLTA